MHQKRAAGNAALVAIAKAFRGLGGLATAANAMQHVVEEARNAGSVSQHVLQGSTNIGGEADKLRAEVNQFLAAVREDRVDERRRCM